MRGFVFCKEDIFTLNTSNVNGFAYHSETIALDTEVSRKRKEVGQYW